MHSFNAFPSYYHKSTSMKVMVRTGILYDRKDKYKNSYQVRNINHLPVALNACTNRPGVSSKLKRESAFSKTVSLLLSMIKGGKSIPQFF